MPKFDVYYVEQRACMITVVAKDKDAAWSKVEDGEFETLQAEEFESQINVDYVKRTEEKENALD